MEQSIYGLKPSLVFYLLSNVNQIFSFYILLAIYGFGGGLARPGNVSILSLSINKNEQGSASGLMGTVFLWVTYLLHFQ